MKEAEHPNTPPHVKAEAASKIFTIPTDLNRDEQQKFREIWRILTGNGSPEKMEQDANHVFEAHKHSGYFVTTDNGILKHRNKLRQICNAFIVKPSELVTLIIQHENS